MLRSAAPTSSDSLFKATRGADGSYLISVYPKYMPLKGLMFEKPTPLEVMTSSEVGANNRPMTGDYDLMAVCPSWNDYGARTKVEVSKPGLNFGRATGPERGATFVAGVTWTAWMDMRLNTGLPNQRNADGKWKTFGQAGFTPAQYGRLPDAGQAAGREHGDMGNLTPRILRCVNELNGAMGQTGPLRRVHHNAESHRNVIFGGITGGDMEGGDAFPLTVFQPERLQIPGYDHVTTLENMMEFRNYATALHKAGYYVPRNWAWACRSAMDLCRIGRSGARAVRSGCPPLPRLPIAGNQDVVLRIVVDLAGFHIAAVRRIGPVVEVGCLHHLEVHPTGQDLVGNAGKVCGDGGKTGRLRNYRKENGAQSFIDLHALAEAAQLAQIVQILVHHLSNLAKLRIVGPDAAWLSQPALLVLEGIPAIGPFEGDDVKVFAANLDRERFAIGSQHLGDDVGRFPRAFDEGTESVEAGLVFALAKVDCDLRNFVVRWHEESLPPVSAPQSSKIFSGKRGRFESTAAAKRLPLAGCGRLCSFPRTNEVISP